MDGVVNLNRESEKISGISPAPPLQAVGAGAPLEIAMSENAPTGASASNAAKPKNSFKNTWEGDSRKLVLPGQTSMEDWAKIFPKHQEALPWNVGGTFNTMLYKNEDLEIWKRKWDVIIAYDRLDDNDKLNEQEQNVKRKREQLLRRMRKCGLVVAKQYTKGSDKEVMLKITAPFKTFSDMSTEIPSNMPLKQEDRQTYEDSGGFTADHITKFQNFLQKYVFRSKVKELMLAYIEYFPGTEDKFHSLGSRFFCSLDRQQYIMHILEAKRWEGGVDMELDSVCKPGGCNNGNAEGPDFGNVKIYNQIFGLHTKRGQKRIKEAWLDRPWTNFKQPQEIIRNYFGEKITYYFSFLEAYTRWCLYLSIGGAITFMVEWLGDGKSGTIDLDHPISVVYCVFVCLWCSLFLEMWKREEKTIAFKFNVSNFQNVTTHRPQFKGQKVKGVITNAGLIEFKTLPGMTPDKLEKIDEEVVWYPLIKRQMRTILGMPVITTFVITVIIGTAFLLILKTEAALHAESTGDSNLGYSMSVSLGNAVFITIMNIAYAKMARKLCDYENHRTDLDYENALIAKTFIFQFVNSYMTLFLIAFALSDPNPDWTKTDAMGNDIPDADQPYQFSDAASEVWGLKIGQCEQKTCMLDLFSQLVMLVGVQQISGNAKEILIPMANRFWKLFLKDMRIKKQKASKQLGKMPSVRSRNQGSVMSPKGIKGTTSPGGTPVIGDSDEDSTKDEIPEVPFFEEQLALTPFMGTFEEYNELMVQYGYMTLFAAAFPMASVLSLLNNMAELKVDAYKFVYETQRPQYAGANTIGTWNSVLQIVSSIAVITNVAIICFTSTILRGTNNDWTSEEYSTCFSTCGEQAALAAQEYTAWATNTGEYSGTDSWLVASNSTTYIEDTLTCMRDCECDGLCLDLPSRFIVFVVMEHLILCLKLLVDYAIPDVPRRVAKALVYRDYQKKKLLAANEGATDHGQDDIVDQWSDNDSGDDVDSDWLEDPAGEPEQQEKEPTETNG